MCKISYGTKLQLEKYHHLYEGLEDVCPELVNNNPAMTHIISQIKFYQKCLTDMVESCVDYEAFEKDLGYD